MRSISEQTVEELGGASSVLVRQKRDHIALDVLLGQLAGSVGEEQQGVLDDICRLVFSHAFAEEAVLWPALRRHVPEGERLTLQVEQEHQEINELMTAVDSSRPGDPDRDELIGRTIELLRQDVRDEEDELLPRLQDAVDVKQLQRLGWAWEVVRRTAPTRPHPVVARRPPGNVLSALPLSAIDRSRDLLDRRAQRTPESAAKVMRSASQALAKAAGVVEQLPPMRRGERPETHVPRQRGHGL
jgi:hemerythrin superfamily protein